FLEIDVLRGIAVIMMIVFHFFFDLDFFGVRSFNLDKVFWFIFARTIAIIFIFLVGLCLTISYARAKTEGKACFKKYLLRGVKIILLGLCITAITFITFPEWTIYFGILHFIGLSIILAYPFLTLKSARAMIFIIILALFFLLFGIFLNKISLNFPYLLWLGLEPKTFYTFDYFPLFPWFGVVLIGIFSGHLLYKGGERQFKIQIGIGKIFAWPLSGLAFLGRHSLIIYLLHQPILSLLILTMRVF
ncbi:MAG: heparan-alpha-glucosaminide N-acetyltransferase, partial [Candidatus Pacearchaeota archaeon]